MQRDEEGNKEEASSGLSCREKDWEPMQTTKKLGVFDLAIRRLGG